MRRADAGDAYVEDKGLAVAVHTRRLPDPEAAFRRLLPILEELADRNDLVVEPGRSVIEVRSPGTHKGLVVERLAEELEIGGFLFAGDDLGDLEAFEAVESLADRGLPTLLVCSASAEESVLVDRSDVVVRGPEGVLDLLRRFTARDARAIVRRARHPLGAKWGAQRGGLSADPLWSGRRTHRETAPRRVCDSSSRGTEGTAQ